MARNSKWEFGIVDPSLVTIIELPKKGKESPAAPALAPLITSAPVTSQRASSPQSSPLSPTSPASESSTSANVYSSTSPDPTAGPISSALKKKRASFNPQPAPAPVSASAGGDSSGAGSGADGGIPKATAKLPQKLSKEQKRNAAEARKLYGVKGSEPVLCVGTVIRVPGWQLGTEERPVRAENYLKLNDGMRVEVVGSISSGRGELWVGRSPEYKYGLVDRSCLKVAAVSTEKDNGDEREQQNRAPPPRPTGPPPMSATPITPAAASAAQLPTAATSSAAVSQPAIYQLPSWND